MLAIVMAWMLTVAVALLVVGNIVYVALLTLAQIMEQITE